MKRLYILPAVLLLMLSASACDSNDLFSDGGSDYRVVYTVDANGESVITSLSYRDRGGALRTVTNPTLPWSTRLAIEPGEQASLSATGTVTSGTFTVRLSATNNRNTVTLNQGCATGTDEVLPKTCDDLNVESRLP